MYTGYLLVQKVKDLANDFVSGPRVVFVIALAAAIN
jgi:hypothetical protein